MDNVAPPIVIPITAANRPKVVRTGKPTIRIDSSNGGIPFFTNYGPAQGLAEDYIQVGITDRSGNLWFGTYGRGVSKYDGKRFTNYTGAQGLANNSLRSILEDRAGNIRFGTNGGGVSRFRGSMENPQRLTPSRRHHLKVNLSGGWRLRELDFPTDLQKFLHIRIVQPKR